MYQGISKMHTPNWFPEDKERLEKVLLELWPNSKINPRKMNFYIDSVKGFYPEVVQDAISEICRTQEFDRRPTIRQLVGKCRDIVNKRYKGSHAGGSEEKHCDWCGGTKNYLWVGLYTESAEKCTAMDIQGKNVLRLSPTKWVVRPDWGRELEMGLEQFVVFCPHCSVPKERAGCGTAIEWSKRFLHFTEFNCPWNGVTKKEWNRSYTLFHRMINQMRPQPTDFDELRRTDVVFHEYLASLPKGDKFEKRKMNVVQKKEQPRDFKAVQVKPEGEVLPIQDEGLPQGSGIPSGDCREGTADSDEGRPR